MVEILGREEARKQALQMNWLFTILFIIFTAIFWTFAIIKPDYRFNVRNALIFTPLFLLAIIIGWVKYNRQKNSDQGGTEISGLEKVDNKIGGVGFRVRSIWLGIGSLILLIGGVNALMSKQVPWFVGAGVILCALLLIYVVVYFWQKGTSLRTGRFY